MKHEYFECTCGSDEHRLVFSMDEDIFNPEFPPELWAGVFLHTYEGFFRRTWTAIKYVLGYKCKYGHFDCFTMRPEDAPRFKKLMQEYIETYDEWVLEINGDKS